MESFPNKRPPNWVARTSNSFYNLINFIFLTVILSIILSVVGNWIYSVIALPSYMTDYLTRLKQAIEWGISNPVIVILIALILILLRSGADIYRRGEVPLSEKKLELRYLKYVIKETEHHTLKGIPTNLIPEDTKLDDVFTPLWFRFNQPMVAHPLTMAEINAVKPFTEKEKERLIEEKNKGWQYKEDDKAPNKINLDELWHLLSKDNPIAVIRSYPGMGKSTLLQALRLHFARSSVDQMQSKRLNYYLKHLGQLPLLGRFEQPLLSINNKSSIIPIYLSLGEYANELTKDSNLPLSLYLERCLNKWDSRFYKFLNKCLLNGRCLVLFDGLNEVIHHREQVQNEIKKLINYYSISIQETPTFNRYLITSRIAGYNPHNFTDYLHFTIADMEYEQIEHLLDGWFKSILNNQLRRIGDIQEQQKNEIENELEREKKNFLNIIKDDKNRSIRDLASKPLLLTLLIQMYQSKIKLPTQRVELYRIITSMLINKHQDAQGHPVISVEKALRFLGPLAYWMQENQKTLARSSEVKAQLAMMLDMSSSSSDEIANLIETFLLQISEAGGLFVYRTEDDLGFSHPTFQEYFAARHMLSIMKNDLEALVAKARRLDDLWREPFLLAVAYLSYDNYQDYNNPRKASEIIAELFKFPPHVDIKSKAHDLCLAALCVIEAKPFTIDDNVEKHIVEHLHETYQEAFQKGDLDICEQICETMNEWLLNLRGSDNYLSPLQELLYMKGAYTLLPIITKQPHTLLPIVYNHLNSGQNESIDIAVDQDLHLLAKTVCYELTTIGSNHSKGYKTILDMLSSLPVSSVNEIKFMLRMIEETENEQIRQACVAAIKKADPFAAQGKDMLDAWNWVCNTSFTSEPEIIRALQIMAEINFMPIYCACVTVLKNVNPSTSEARCLLELWNWICYTYSKENIFGIDTRAICKSTSYVTQEEFNEK